MVFKCTPGYLNLQILLNLLVLTLMLYHLIESVIRVQSQITRPFVNQHLRITAARTHHSGMVGGLMKHLRTQMLIYTLCIITFTNKQRTPIHDFVKSETLARRFLAQQQARTIQAMV